MSTIPVRHHRHVRRTSALAVAAALVALALSATDARAQAQTSGQQKCLNALYKRAAKVGQAQGKVNEKCVKARQGLAVAQLGNPGQEQTTDACITNDTKGTVAKAAAGIAATEASTCATESPSFGAGSADQIGGAASSQSRAVLRDAFGPNLQSVVITKPGYDDKAAVGCQPAAVKGADKLYDTLWKELGQAAKSALAGKSGPAVTSAAELENAIEGALTADAKGKIAKSALAMTNAMGKTCGATSEALIRMFHGRCLPSTSTTAAQLEACAVGAVRCRFCRAVRGATGLGFDCDAFDDGAADDSCVGFANAHEIMNPAELITGPLATGQVGDTMLENGVARFIIQKPGVRDMWSVGAFGGNLIDVELVGHPGLDNFLEMQPAINIETVINATSLEIVNDGSDGGAAVVRTCGPDDILDFINPSTIIEGAGLDFPATANDNDQDVDGCTEYILEPDATYLKLVTTIYNNEPSTLGVFAGDYVNASGELEQWGSGDEGIGVRLLGDDMGVLSYFGYGEATGVDYGITTIPIPDSNEKTGYFSTSGVTYLLHSQSVLSAILSQDPVFHIPAGGSKSYTRYFGVGDGSGGNMVTLENLLKGMNSGEISGCVTVNGVPAPGARVTAGAVSAGAITRVRSTWVTGADGCYHGTIPAGTNGLVAWREGTLYEGGASTPPVHTVSISQTTPKVQNFDLPAPGHVSVTVVDENSDPVPARVSVVGFDPSPDPVFSAETGLFLDQSDKFPFGIARALYTNAAGAVDFDMEPGTYRLYVSRGAEYSLFEQALTVTGGVTTNVAAQIGRVLDTTGFISSDHHVHGIFSADSRVGGKDRVQQFAGEGVDNIIMTDHHHHTDLLPRIDALGFTPFVTATIGEEITTWDTGHYNAYPLLVDPTRPSGGSTDWGGAAPPGEDFTSHGSYILTPAQIATLATTGPTSTPDTLIQINHIDSHFVPMHIDTSFVPPQSFMTPAELLNFRMDPASGNLFHHFEALELWNGHNRKHQSQFLDERIGIWFNHLNQGLITTAITDTDTHAFANLETAGGRTWAASSTDDPPSISPAEMTQSIRAGKAVGGQGLYVQTRLVDATEPVERRRPDARRQHAPHGGQSGRGAGGARRRAGAAVGAVRHDPRLCKRVDHPVADEPGARALQRDADDDTDRRHRLHDHADQRAPERSGGLAPRGPCRDPVHEHDAGHVVRGRREGHRRRVASDVPGASGRSRARQQHDARESHRREPRRERRDGARIHQRALRRRRREPGIRRAAGTVKAATAAAAVVLGIAAAVAVVTWRRPSRDAAPTPVPRSAAVPARAAASVVAPPRAVATSVPALPARRRPAATGGGAILAAAGRAQAVVAGVVSAPQGVDAHGWRAQLHVDDVLLGDVRLGETITIAWEELSAAREVRFADGQRVLVVLDALPTQSLWRRRFPAGARDQPVLVVASGGDAFLPRPDGVTLDALGHYLAMAPEARDGTPGAERLAELVRGGDPAVAREALTMLEQQTAKPELLGSEGAASLLAAAESPEREPSLRRAALGLAARDRLPGTRATALALTEPGSPIRADAYRALAALPDGLPADACARLLVDADPDVRVVGIEIGRDDLPRERLVTLVRSDVAPTVRLAAGRLLVARRRDGETAEGTHAIADVIGLLDDPDAGVRSGIAESIGALGDAAVGPLSAVVDDGSERAALAAVLGLAHAGKQGAVLLTSIAKAHDNPAVRAFARLALGEAPAHSD